MKWEIYKDRKGMWRWRCRAENGNIIGASSQGYKDKRNCEQNAECFGYTG